MSAQLLARRRRRLTVDALLDLYLDGLDADERLLVKTRFDYRENAESYVRPLLGGRRLRDVTPETILERILREQRKRQAEERLASADYVESDHVFTRVEGGPYHPQSLSRQLAVLSVEAGQPRPRPMACATRAPP